MTRQTITIRFSTDKAGRRRAHFWGQARRWLPMSTTEAEMKLATGEEQRGRYLTTYVEQGA